MEALETVDNNYDILRDIKRYLLTKADKRYMNEFKIKQNIDQPDKYYIGWNQFLGRKMEKYWTHHQHKYNRNTSKIKSSDK